MLEVRDVRKRFGDVLALDGVTLTVRPGSIVGFLGPNGAGKSTTMRAVMGLIGIDGGDIRWDGAPIGTGARRRFGYMPAERGMYPKMTVRDQITYFARLAGLSGPRAGRATDAWMERLGITARADQEVQALSSGNQQRVQLAIALVHDPDLLILDEPFSGLDPVAVETMKGVLAAEVAAGTAVLFSSHQLDLVADVSRDVVIIDAGRIVLEGDVRDIRQRSSTRDAVVVFAAPSTWCLDDGDDHALHGLHGVQVVEHDGRTFRLRVRGSVRPSEVLDAASRAGTVVEFSFAPPDLSEVFLDAVGGRPQSVEARP